MDNTGTRAGLRLLALPDDCLLIVAEHLPSVVEERCYVCGAGLVFSDGKGRRHYDAHIVCTESVVVCLV